MNIFNKISLQGLVKNRTRTVVTVIGVILSTVMITAVSTFAVSLQSYMVDGAAEKYGHWQIQFTDADDSFVQQQRENDEVKAAEVFDNIGYAKLKGGINQDKPYLHVAGFNEGTFDMIPIELTSGRLPENDGEVIIPSHVLTNGGVDIKPGDTLTLDIGNRMSGTERLNQHDPLVCDSSGKVSETLAYKETKFYKVVGIYQRPSFEERTAPGYTVITRSDGEGSAESMSLFVTFKKPGSIKAYTKDAPGDYDYSLNDDVLRFMGLSGDTMFNTLLYSVGLVLILLIMVGSVFLIYNSFAISLSERTHQLGILMSIGATERQLKNSVMFEGLCIGVIGIPIGVLVGLPVIRLVIAIVTDNFGNIMYDTVKLSMKVSVPVLAAAAVISMITILISAYVPARRAASLSVMECIRQTNDIKVKPGALKTSSFSERLYGIEGILALKNFKRNRKRYRSIVMSLTLSVVLFVAANAFVTNLSSMSDQMVSEVGYDIRFYSGTIDDDQMAELYDMLKTSDGVTESSFDGKEMYFSSDDPEKSAEQMKEMLSSRGITENYMLTNVYDVLETNRNIVFVVNLFSYVFTAMIALIAVANVFNTISTNIMLRRRELAMLRSVGMADSSFNRMMRFECMFYGMRTIMISVPVSVVLAWLIYKGLTIGETQLSFEFPWLAMGISILGVFLMIFITMLYATGRIRRENIIDAIRDDLA